MIELRKIDHDNWEDVLKLKVADHQKNFVAPNIYTLAEAYVEIVNGDEEDADYPPMIFAIYKDNVLVGFTAMEQNEPDEDEYLYMTFGDKAVYNFYRFMIDEKFQGKGYGREAMVKILEYLKSFPQGEVDSISLSYEPENDVARKLYESLGFVETGHIEDGEMVARLGLK
ncbi:MAG: GNAT family N-acetyltransferase [Defluviitaleaceae bacterium]|nr:GNAT family N-acetyltransferase [Defluviitaleaceae bacterium]